MKKGFSFILTMVPFFVLGVLFDKYDNPIYFFVLLFGVIISFILCTIIHESGHLVFGLLTNYKLTSFRIFRFIFFKENGKIMVKKEKVPGIVGQCIMYYEEYSDNMPYKLYNYGGLILNFTLAVIGYTLLFFTENMILFGIILSFSTMSITLFLANYLPIGAFNDGMNVRMINKDKMFLKVLYDQTKMMRLFKEGYLITDLDNYDYDLDKMNTLLLPLVIISGYKAVLNDDKVEGKRILDALKKHYDNLDKDLKLSVYTEILSLECMLFNDSGNTIELFNSLPNPNKRLLFRIKEISFLSGSCFHLVYQIKDYDKALKRIEELEKIANNHYYKAYKEYYLFIVKTLKERIIEFTSKDEIVLEENTNL